MAAKNRNFLKLIQAPRKNRGTYGADGPDFNHSYGEKLSDLGIVLGIVPSTR